MAGRLAVVARPCGGDWLYDEFASLCRAGIQTVVSLLEPEEALELGLAAEHEAATASGVQFLVCPIPDRGVPASTDAAFAALYQIAAKLESGENVALHCRQGIGRAGMMTAGALKILGLSTTSAVSAVSQARGLEIPETPEQLAWLTQVCVGRPSAVPPKLN